MVTACDELGYHGFDSERGFFCGTNGVWTSSQMQLLMSLQERLHEHETRFADINERLDIISSELESKMAEVTDTATEAVTKAEIAETKVKEVVSKRLPRIEESVTSMCDKGKLIYQADLEKLSKEVEELKKSEAELEGRVQFAELRCASNAVVSRVNHLRHSKQIGILLKNAAECGDSTAQNAYGCCLRDGDGVEKSDFEAAKYFRLSCEQGNSDGECNYGVCLRDGKGVEANVNEGARYIKLSADHCNSDGENNYGVCLEKGCGVRMDAAEAARYYKMSADHGNSEGQSNYGLCLWNGTGVSRDADEALKYMKASADQGNVTGCYRYGTSALVRAHETDGSFQDAVEWIWISSELGHIWGTRSFGFCLQFGLYLQLDLALGAQYYKRAADAGDAEGQFNYATTLTAC